MSQVVPTIGQPAPAFEGKALVDGVIKRISSADYAGKVSALQRRMSANTIRKVDERQRSPANLPSGLAPSLPMTAMCNQSAIRIHNIPHNNVFTTLLCRDSRVIGARFREQDRQVIGRQRATACRWAHMSRLDHSCTLFCHLNVKRECVNSRFVCHTVTHRPASRPAPVKHCSPPSSSHPLLNSVPP